MFFLPWRALLSGLAKCKGQKRGSCPKWFRAADPSVSVNVFPICALQCICKYQEYPEIDQDADADVDALVSHRLADVIQIIDQIGDKGLVLHRLHRSCVILR